MEKSYLYNAIANMIQEPGIKISKLKTEIGSIMKKLIKGKKVQE